MAVIGIHEILLVPSLKGGQRAIGRELDGMAGKTGEQAGRKMGNRLGGALKVGALAGGAAVVAGLGTALTKGFGRLTAIENARAKLTGLGHDAQSVEKIMGDALASVKGTAFGMDEAASVAAQAVAAGIKPGKELEATLRLVGDAATIGGSTMGEMGSIFMKVAASNKVQMDVINQLHDQGVPALQLLANELGVTAEEASKMASKGQIDFATFSAAMEEGLGGAALKSGETLTGAMKNAGAAMGRFGANLMAGVYPQVKQFFTGFIAFMEPLEAGAKVAGEAIGKFIGRAVKGVQGLWDLIVNRDYTAAMREAFGVHEDSAFVDFTIRARDGLVGISRLLTKGDYAGQLRSAFGWEEDSPIVTMLLGVRDGISWLVNEGIPKLGDFGRAMWDARDQIKVAVAAITVLLIPSMILSATEAAKSAAAHVAAWATKRREAVKTAVQYQVTAYQMIGHMLAAAGTMAITATAHAIAWGRMSGAALLHGAKIAAGWFLAMGPIGWVIGAIAGIAALVILNWEHIANFTRPIWESISGFVATAWEAIVGAVQSGIDWVVQLATGAWNGAVDLFGTVWQSVADFLNVIWETSIKPLFDGIVSAFEFVAGVLNTIWLTTLKPVFDAIAEVVGWLWKHIIYPTFYNISQFVALAFDIIVYAWRNWLQPMFAELGEFLLDLWNNIISNVFTWIADSWQVMVDGVKWAWENLLKPAIDGVASAFKWLWENVISPVLGWIGEKWDEMVAIYKYAWENILKPMLDEFGKWVYDTWKKWIEPVLNWIGEAWGGMVNGIRDLWNGVLKPVWDAVGAFIGDTWTKYIQPAFDAIGDAWGGMVNGIRDFWNDTLKPVLKAFGDFVYITVVQRIKDGVAMIVGAWNGLSRGFGSTINWVLTHVWNRGIVKAFNDIAAAVGSDAKLIPAGLIALGDSGSSRAAVGRGGGNTRAQARAKGGNVHAGKPYLVGELGPEYIFPDRDGYVATARETRKMRDLTEEESRKAAGMSPRDARAPMGEFNGAAAWDEFKRQTGLGKLLGTDQLTAGVGQLGEFAKGALDSVMNAARSVLTSPFGQLMLDAGGNMVKKVVDWATGKDREAMAGGGSFGGEYTGPRSGFARPSGGPITSWFGPRWGKTHTGIDFAMAIGSLVRAAWSGVVQKTGWNALAGHTGKGMVLGHGGGRGSYYGHLSGWLKRPGDQVRAGEPIALSGNTGKSTGPHLHWGVLQGGRPVNGNALLRDNGGRLPPGLSSVLNATGGYEHVFNQRQISALETAVTGNSGGINVYGNVGYDPQEIMDRARIARKQQILAAGI